MIWCAPLGQGIYSEVEFENHVCRYSLCFIAEMHLQQVCFISSYEGGGEATLGPIIHKSEGIGACTSSMTMIV